jgi:hypothetical protein
MADPQVVPPTGFGRTDAVSLLRRKSVRGEAPKPRQEHAVPRPSPKAVDRTCGCAKNEEECLDRLRMWSSRATSVTIKRINQQISITVFAVIPFRKRLESAVCASSWSVARRGHPDSTQWVVVRLPPARRTALGAAVQPCPVVLSVIVSHLICNQPAASTINDSFFPKPYPDRLAPTGNLGLNPIIRPEPSWPGPAMRHAATPT